MPKDYQRIDRISEEVRRELDALIRDELHDPRIQGTWSITRAEVTRDLRYAKVYVSVLEEENRAPLMAALKSAAGYLRHALSRGMIIRQSPELKFLEDRNIEYGVYISQRLHEVRAGESGAPEEEESHEAQP